MTTDPSRDFAAEKRNLTIKVTADPGLQALQRVINVLAVNDIMPRSIVSDHEIGATRLTVQFFDRPPRFQQLRTRIEAIVGVRQID